MITHVGPLLALLPLSEHAPQILLPLGGVILTILLGVLAVLVVCALRRKD